MTGDPKLLKRGRIADCAARLDPKSPAGGRERGKRSLASVADCCGSRKVDICVAGRAMNEIQRFRIDRFVVRFVEPEVGSDNACAEKKAERLAPNDPALAVGVFGMGLAVAIAPDPSANFFTASSHCG